MNLTVQLSDFLFRSLGISYQPLEHVKFLEKSFQVIKGSLRKEEDYDDGWLLALALHSSRVFDIGCNIGQSAFVLLYPEVVQQIVMVDANPKALAIAAENMILNHLSHRTSFVCAFVSEQIGENILFFTVGTGAAGSMYRSHAKTASQIGASFVVPTISVDWLCDWYGCVPDLVKVDVEGADVKVLQGASELAKKQKTKFFVEMHSNLELSMIENAERALQWCESSQYTAWYLKEKIKLESPRQIEQRGRCHLLLLPQSDNFPDYLYPIKQSSSLSDALQISEQAN